MGNIDCDYKNFWSPSDDKVRDDRITAAKTWGESTQQHLPLILWGEVQKASGTALEIGCGIGRLMKPLSRRFDKVIGLDFSPAMIEGSVDYLKGCENTEVKRILDDLRFDIESDSVDLVYSVITFQHIPWENVLRSYLLEAKRVLKPGGLLRVQTHKGRPSGSKVFAEFHGRYFLDLERFQVFIKGCGFNIVDGQTKMGHKNWLWVTAQHSPSHED